MFYSGVCCCALQAALHLDQPTRLATAAAFREEAHEASKQLLLT